MNINDLTNVLTLPIIYLKGVQSGKRPDMPLPSSAGHHADTEHVRPGPAGVGQGHGRQADLGLGHPAAAGKRPGRSPLPPKVHHRSDPADRSDHRSDITARHAADLRGARRRNIRFVTLLISGTAYTVTVLGINNTTANFPAEKFQSTEERSTESLSEDKKQIILNSSDNLFSDLRDKNFNAVSRSSSIISNFSFSNYTLKIIFYLNIFSHSSLAYSYVLLLQFPSACF